MDTNNQKTKRRQQISRILFVAAVIWTAWVSLVPPSALPGIVIWDKLVHALNYGLLTLLLLSSQMRPRYRLTGSVMMLSGMVIELAQTTTGYRTGDWHDALANGVGILVAVGLWYIGACWCARLAKQL